MAKDKDYETRENIHTLVWMYPLPVAAGELSIPPTRLKQICRHYDIPVPGKPYWDSMAQGKKQAMRPLHRTNGGPMQQIPLFCDPPVLKAKVGRKARSIPPLHESDNALHPLVQHWLNLHRTLQEKNAQEARHSGYRRALSDPSLADLYRLRVTSAFFRAVEAAGGEIKPETNRQRFSIALAGALLTCTIAEKMERSVPGAPPVQGWTAWPEDHKEGMHPTGRLRFSLNGRQPQQIRENQPGTAIDKIPKFISVLQAAAAEIIQARRQAEKEKSAREAAMWHREELRKDAERDEARWLRFRQQAADWEEYRRLRAFLAALRQIPAGDTTEVDGVAFIDWLAWAEARILRGDPLSHPENVFYIASNTSQKWG